MELTLGTQLHAAGPVIVTRGDLNQCRLGSQLKAISAAKVWRWAVPPARVRHTRNAERQEDIRLAERFGQRLSPAAPYHAPMRMIFRRAATMNDKMTCRIFYNDEGHALEMKQQLDC
jgi:hypothetical protein